MSNKRIYTHMSELAVKGLRRLAKGREVKVFMSPTGEYTAIVEGRVDPDSVRIVEAWQQRSA